MQRHLLLALNLLLIVNLSAQDQLDSNDHREPPQLKDLTWLMDSTYKAFKTLRFTSLRVMYPSFKTYRTFIDTSAAGHQSDITQFTMYNSFWNGIRIDHIKMMKKTSKANIIWGKTHLDSFYMDTGHDGGLTYARVTWVIGFNKKKFKVSALCLQMKEKWFLVDELKYGGYIEPKKKKKKKVEKVVKEIIR